MNTKVRTTISLSKRTLYKIKKENKSHKECQRLVKLCLARFIQKMDLYEWSKKTTCRYNDESCPETLDLYFDQEELRTLKTIRITQSISLSLLITLAIDKYLKKILSMTEILKVGIKATDKFIRWCSWLDSIYTEAKFNIKQDGGIIKTNIVIQKLAFQANLYQKENST